MINFNYETDFKLENEDLYIRWIRDVIASEGFLTGAVAYVFCDDTYLVSINQKYLNHNTFTDIITFDYTEGDSLSGDIFISIERIQENAVKFEVTFDNELLRVMSHGLLHLAGYGDKGKKQKILMRIKEEEKIKLFHVEQ